MAILHSQPTTPMPKALRGFTDINRYWDKERGVYAAKILPGQYYVTINDEAITTVLGSCVSACIRDRVFGVGGMNHFMLPANRDDMVLSSSSDAARYGNFAMEQMINDILKNGGKRENLEIKVFGGGRVLENMQSLDIGMRNIRFVKEYIQTEGLKLVTEDLGDVFPRKVVYFPTTGKVMVKKLRKLHNRTIQEREDNYLHSLEEKPVSGDIELF